MRELLKPDRNGWIQFLRIKYFFCANRFIRDQTVNTEDEHALHVFSLIDCTGINCFAVCMHMIDQLTGNK